MAGEVPTLVGGYLPWLQGTYLDQEGLTALAREQCQIVKKCQLIKKMSNCQKDVKLSKRCQVDKKMSNVKKSNIWTMEEVHKKN